MSDQENFNEQPTPVDPNAAPEPLKQAQESTVRELRDVPVEAVPTEDLPDVAKDIKESEPDAAKEARRQGEAVLNKPIEAIEDAVNAADAQNRPQTVEHALATPSHDITTINLRGRQIVINQPIYTVVFGTLAVITVVEVLFAEVFPDGFLLTLVLVALSLCKALMVMWFYMHLKDDSRIFAFAIALPVMIALVATLFLAAVPPFGY